MTKVVQQGVMKGTLLLTLTSIIVKVLSAVYRVPFQNLVGDEGFYVYQQVYPIYGIAMTLSLSGVPLFLSKLIAEKETATEQEAIIQGVFPLLFWGALFLFAFFFWGGPALAFWMGDRSLTPLIKTVAVLFLLSPFLTVYRGYFQGLSLMAPTAYSQLVEQVLRVAVVLTAASCYTTFQWSVYQMGTVAMAGALVGAVGALVVLLLARPSAPTDYQFNLFRGGLKLTHSRPYCRRLFIEGGLLSGYTALLLLFQLVDSFVIKKQLVMGGLAQSEAKVIKGIYDRGQPLAQVGLVMALALVTSFLPPLTKYYNENKLLFYERTSRLFVRVGLLVASAASLGLIMILPYINKALFDDQREMLSLSLFMLVVLLLSLVLVMQTLYQSQNKFRAPFLALVIGLSVKISLSSWLTFRWGTVGASLATVFSLGLVFGVLWHHYDATQRRKLLDRVFFLKLTGCLAVMVLSLSGYRILISIWLGTDLQRGVSFIVALGGVMLGSYVLLKQVIWLKLFTIREWLSLPFGKKVLMRKR